MLSNLYFIRIDNINFDAGVGGTRWSEWEVFIKGDNYQPELIVTAECSSTENVTTLNWHCYCHLPRKSAGLTLVFSKLLLITNYWSSLQSSDAGAAPCLPHCSTLVFISNDQKAVAPLTDKCWVSGGGAVLSDPDTDGLGTTLCSSNEMTRPTLLLLLQMSQAIMIARCPPDSWLATTTTRGTVGHWPGQE